MNQTEKHILLSIYFVPAIVLSTYRWFYLLLTMVLKSPYYFILFSLSYFLIQLLMLYQPNFHIFNFLIYWFYIFVSSILDITCFVTDFFLKNVFVNVSIFSMLHFIFLLFYSHFNLLLSLSFLMTISSSLILTSYFYLTFPNW